MANYADLYGSVASVNSIRTDVTDQEVADLHCQLTPEVLAADALVPKRPLWVYVSPCAAREVGGERCLHPGPLRTSLS